MSSTLFVNNITTASGSNISIASGKKLVAPEAGAFVSPGQIVQVTYGSYATIAAQGGTSYANTNLQGAITPKYQTSKILVQMEIPYTFSQATTSERQADFRIQRAPTGGTTVQVGFTRGHQKLGSHGNPTYTGKVAKISVLDDPDTTVEIIYYVQMKLNAGTADIFTCHDSGLASIVMMEVAQ